MTALRVPAFRRVWAAGLISETGDWLLLIGLPVLVYQITGSTLGTGVAFLVEMLPPIALMPLAGWIADHLNRSRTLAVLSFIQAMALVPLLIAHSLVIIYVILAVESGLATIFESAKNALLPTLVGMDQLISANSLIGLIQNLGRLVGAPLGGLLLALGGPRTVGAVDCASFLVIIPLLASVPDGRTEPVQSRRAQGKRPRPKILGALAVMAMISLAQGAFVVLFVVFVAKMLHGGSTEIGLLRGLQAVGALACSLLLAGARAQTLPSGRLAGFGALAIGIVSLFTWNAPRLTTKEAVYIILFIMVGFPAMLLSTGLTSWLQEATTDAQRGRAFAAYITVGTSFQAAGSLIAGILGDHIDLSAILNGQAVIYVVAGTLALVTLGRIIKPLSPTGPAEQGLAGEGVNPIRGLATKRINGRKEANPFMGMTAGETREHVEGSVRRWLDQVTINSEVTDLCPGYSAFIIVAEGLRPGPSDAGSDGQLRDAEDFARTVLNGRAPDQLELVAAWRDAFRAFGAKPNRTRSSVEALLRRVDDGLPRIDRLTDAYNAVSVAHLLPIGGEDLDQYRGAARLTRASGDEPFDTVHNGEPVTDYPEPGEVIWRDEAGVTCRRWNWRQCARTRITPATVNAVFILDGLPAFGQERLIQAGDDLSRRLAEGNPDIRLTSRQVGLL